MGLEIPPEKRSELENTVVKLNRVNSFEFPETSRITQDFLVERGLLFSQDHYGPLSVYDLKTGKEVSRFMYNPNWMASDSIAGMASDGNHIYLHIKGGGFNPRDEDVLIAKITNPSAMEAGDETKYKDGLCSFIGKKVSELKGDDYINTYKKAKESGVVGRIDSFSLDEFAMHTPSLVWDPGSYTERNTRFLIHEDMDSLIHLTPRNGHVEVYYNTHLGEGGCTDWFALKDGELLSELEEKKEGVEISEGILESPLRFQQFPDSPFGFIANKVVADTVRVGGEDPKEEYFRFQIVFGEREPSGSLGRIIGLEHKEGRLHILRDNITTEKVQGSWDVLKPARVDSYGIELKTLD